MIHIEEFDKLKKDYYKYNNNSRFSCVRLLCEIHSIPGLHYMMWLRLAAATAEEGFLGVLHEICRRRLKRVGIRYNFDIPYDTKIGGGFLIRHFGLLIINHKCTIGDNCTIVPGTIIGKSKGRVPCIGNNVEIGANSSIIGGVSIGDNAIIGAGSVVVHNVEANSVVAGNPAHSIK